MSILKGIKKGKSLIIFLAIAVFLTAAFILGRLSAPKESSRINVYLPDKSLASSFQAVVPKESYVIASKNGTKYHFPWCSGAKRISEENKIVFASNTEAKEAGYEPSSNCKGLE